MVNRAEELIADLEAEIVKRDARIANLERLLNNTSEIAQAVEQELAALKAQQPSAGVVDGWVMVPERMHLDASLIDAINYHCGDGQEDSGYGKHNDGLLWVGFTGDADGVKSYGLNIATAEYPEEGSTQLVEFAATPPASADAVSVPRELLERTISNLLYGSARDNAEELRALLARQEVNRERREAVRPELCSYLPCG